MTGRLAGSRNLRYRKLAKLLVITVCFDDVQARRDGDATHEQAAHRGCVPLTGRRTA